MLYDGDAAGEGGVAVVVERGRRGGPGKGADDGDFLGCNSSRGEYEEE